MIASFLDYPDSWRHITYCYKGLKNRELIKRQEVALTVYSILTDYLVSPGRYIASIIFCIFNTSAGSTGMINRSSYSTFTNIYSIKYSSWAPVFLTSSMHCLFMFLYITFLPFSLYLFLTFSSVSAPE